LDRQEVKKNKCPLVFLLRRKEMMMTTFLSEGHLFSQNINITKRCTVNGCPGAKLERVYESIPNRHNI
jgi:hypothetical protein